MKTRHLNLLSSVLVFTFAASAAIAKDKPVSLEQCPAPVQAVIKQYQANGALEEIGLDENKKTGGPAVYEAKFQLTDGRRVELHIAENGSVINVEEKKAKN